MEPRHWMIRSVTTVIEAVTQNCPVRTWTIRYNIYRYCSVTDLLRGWSRVIRLQEPRHWTIRSVTTVLEAVTQNCPVQTGLFGTISTDTAV